MSKKFIGVMTGTSADALDGCIVSFDDQFQLIGRISLDLEKSYKKDYEECLMAGYKTIDESKKLSELENILNNQTVELVETLLDKKRLKQNDIAAIGFSGQTIFHTRQRSYQIGNPQKISDSLGIRVLSDFRNFDIALGGMGAPLVPFFHKYLYSERDKNKLIFNIGGIANGTYLIGEEISLASDVGPGNCLMDLVANEKFNRPFDFNGQEASKGQTNNILLTELLTKCENMKFPRADDKKDYYNLMNEIPSLDANELMRTLAEFSAEMIKIFCDHCNNPKDIIFHGGGTKNLFLMDLIRKKINSRIKTTDAEVESKFVEAAAFAYLAYMERGEIFSPR